MSGISFLVFMSGKTLWPTQFYECNYKANKIKNKKRLNTSNCLRPKFVFLNFLFGQTFYYLPNPTFAIFFASIFSYCGY